MKKTLTIACIFLSSLGMIACNDTAQGMAEDTKENVAAVEKAGEKAAENVGEAAADVSATSLTARIKTALIANPITNEDGLLINVESDADKVTLEGHVMTEKQKMTAGDLAMEVLKDTKSSHTFQNNLVIKK
ncbi:MAG: BON domain-containing protein [Chthonomonas sp.]|nr:BON domain-containing protein [Chthonomonas sp.]